MSGYVGPSNAHQDNPYPLNSQEYHLFEADKLKMQRSHLPRITASARSIVFAKIGGVILALGAAAWFFGWREIPLIGDSFWLLYTGGLLIIAGLYPLQAGCFLFLIGVLLIAVPIWKEGLWHTPLGNWVFGALALAFGWWVWSKGKAD
ncbi:MAG: hypothetical protein ACE5IR_22770 [bacterium]